MYNYESAMYDRFAFQNGKINHDDILCGYSCWLVDPINLQGSSELYKIIVNKSVLNSSSLSIRPLEQTLLYKLTIYLHVI